ncbi:SMP-30/gluconolactonase/LRE family protein [Sinorhizobium medicae]|uniref:SMP-30/gluconolactonase/LRE family protein n=1 Tax=Sinorhizobium medicae TaxID=110321 RepID=UPI000FDC1200|nr:SMP-30/gluconolactonase/LRE family protein [Sinorhizobium medicae]RVP46686.1 SMP-30/gluconolactonase/LRE family protein [Sinorhizobium medicae]RVP75885.1 SMP-30/gluconolactonase/LRE family protein [Sinorhizobium medicae]UWU12205.1 SMP-30/gluconolactonase/LRE family protein [Sinorhizobium medicae]
MSEASLILDAKDIVGESILWSEEEKALYWVDIVGKRIHRLEPENGRHDLWPTPDFVTSIGMRADGGFIVGLTRAVCLWTPEGVFEEFAVPEPDLPENRLNEGRVSPDGSFWVATMQSNLNPDGSPKDMDRQSGAIYRIDPAGHVAQLTPNEYGISNTMGWTRDDRFFFADTLANEIYVFDCDLSAGTIDNRRTISAGFERGLPDGSCLDAEGRLWNCRVAGGAAVAGFDGNGRLLELVELPASWPTSCAFGGADLATLYVTSARFAMPGAHLDAHPLEGGLFAVEGVGRGLAEPKFGSAPDITRSALEIAR